VALAVDMYGGGATTRDREEAGKLAGALRGNPYRNQTIKPVRLIGYHIGTAEYWVATNRYGLSAEDLAIIYKLRWEIGNFFGRWKPHRWTWSYAKVLNFEKFEGVGRFRPTPPSPEAGYPLVCLEPGQSLT